VIEEETNPSDVSVEKDVTGNTPRMSEVLRENRDDVTEFNAYDKADDFNGKKREDLVDFIHQGIGEVSILRIDLCETGGELRDPQQVTYLRQKSLNI
jgi:hypothetical protein